MFTPPAPEQEYIYLGDRLTAPGLKGSRCRAIRRSNGKCIRGRNGSMLVFFANGIPAVVPGRLLRKVQRIP